MDTTFGVLCLIPPIVAIVLALVTRETILSLFVAVWLGSTMINGYNPLVGFVHIVSDYIIPSLSGNASMIVLVTLAGGMIAMLRDTGAAQAFAMRVTKVINTAKKGQVVTCLSAFIFCYTEPCLMLGTIMRPVTDTVRVSRAKLSYILDSMGCNLAIWATWRVRAFLSEWPAVRRIPAECRSTTRARSGRTVRWSCFWRSRSQRTAGKAN